MLIENAFQYQEPPVLEKPEYEFESIVPTTYRPTGSYRNTFRKTSPQSFPGSIQDQLPPVKQGQDTRIPYITETTTQRHVQPTTGTRVVFPVQTESVPPLDFAIDVRNAPRPAIKRPPPQAISTTTAPVDKKIHHTTIATIKDVEVTTYGESGLTTKSPITELQDIQIEEVPSKIDAVVISSSPSTLVISETISEENQHPTTSEKALEVPEITTPRSVTAGPELEMLVTESPAPTATLATSPNIITTTTESATQPPLQTQQSEIRPVLSELLNTMEPLEHNRFSAPFPKKLHSRKVTTDPTGSADYVTDLTLKGLTDTNAVHASVSRYSKNINMTSVIGYVIDKFNATAPPPNVYPQDYPLSLDAKILQDTNWDGFQPVIPTTDRDFETTTVWPITVTTLPTTTTEPVALTTMDTIPPTTTTEAATPPTERETVVIATRMTQSVSRLSKPRYRSRARTEKPSPTVLTTTEYSQRGGTYQTPFSRNRITTTEQPTTSSDIDTTDVTTEAFITTTEPTWRDRTYHRPSQRSRTTTEEPASTPSVSSNENFEINYFTTTLLPTTVTEYATTDRMNYRSNQRDDVIEESTVEPPKSENLQETDFPTETPTTKSSPRGRKYHRKPPVRNFSKFQEKVTEATVVTVSSSQTPQDQDSASIAEVASELPTSESPRRGRKYQRRPPVTNFSKFQEQKSTEPPVRFGTLSRPFYPKRTRPNVTLTFGNRATKRIDDSAEKRPERVTSIEEVKARRNLYKRRMYPSQLRRATTEDSVAPEET